MIAGVLAAATIIAIAAGNTVFIARDSYDFRQVDGAFYSERALWIAGAIADDGFQWSDLNAGHDHIYNSSFNWVLGGVFARVFSPTPKCLRIYSSLYLPLALIYVFLLARLALPVWGALIAVFLGGTSTAVLECSRYFVLDAPLALPLAGCLYHGIRSEGMTKPGHVVAALLFVAFGGAVKLPFCGVAFPPFAIFAAYGWICLYRQKRWRGLAVTAVWQGALLCAATIALKGKTDYIQSVFLASGQPAQWYEFSVIRPYNQTAPGWYYSLAHWSMGLLWMLRRVSFPLALIGLAGVLTAVFRLRDFKKAMAVLSVPLAFIATNFIYVGAGTHEEFERYFGPVLALYGIPVAAAACLATRKILRYCLAGALSLLSILNFAGPRLPPAQFDAQPICLFPSIRLTSKGFDEKPAVVLKTWDEPAARPELGGSREKILTAIEKSLAAAEAVRLPCKVACLCPEWPLDDGMFQYERMSGENLRFVAVESFADFMDCDFALVLSSDYSPLPANEAREMLDTLESPGLRKRLHLEPILELALPRGEMLELYRRRTPLSEIELLDEAAVWIETGATAEEMQSRILEVADCARDAEHKNIAEVLNELSQTWPGVPDSIPQSPSLKRLAQWGAAVSLAPGPGRGDAILKALANGPPAAPGMILQSAIELMRSGNVNEASALFETAVKKYPFHAQTWKAIKQLIPHGLKFPEPVAVYGDPLASSYFRASRHIRYDSLLSELRAARQMAQAGHPGFLENKLALVEAMKKDQPQSLKTFLLAAASIESKDEYGEELKSLLESALGLSGKEETDRDLHCALGRVFLKKNDESEARRHFIRGGWPGVEQWLAWLEESGDKERYLRDLRKLSDNCYSIDLKGSDIIRIRAIEAFGETDPVSAYRQFAQMNRTPVEEEKRIFGDLVSQADDKGLAQFEKELERARASFYSETRSDEYAALIREERAKRQE